MLNIKGFSGSSPIASCPVVLLILGKLLLLGGKVGHYFLIGHALNSGIGGSFFSTEASSVTCTLAAEAGHLSVLLWRSRLSSQR